MDKRELDWLWQLPWFDRRVRVHYGLDPRRHLRWDRHERILWYIIRRSIPRNGSTGRFALDERTLQWLLEVERQGQVEGARIVLVEDWKQPLRVVHTVNARAQWEDHLERIVPSNGPEGSSYWWLDDNGEPQDAWLGPVLRSPPF